MILHCKQPPPLNFTSAVGLLPCGMLPCTPLLQDGLPLMHRALKGLRNSTSPDPPFLALLHRLLQADPEVDAQAASGLTPLGLLLQGFEQHDGISRGVVDAAQTLLSAGASLAAAGGH